MLRYICFWLYFICCWLYPEMWSSIWLYSSDLCVEMVLKKSFLCDSSLCGWWDVNIQEQTRPRTDCTRHRLLPHHSVPDHQLCPPTICPYIIRPRTASPLTEQTLTSTKTTPQGWCSSTTSISPRCLCSLISLGLGGSSIRVGLSGLDVDLSGLDVCLSFVDVGLSCLDIGLSFVDVGLSFLDVSLPGLDVDLSWLNVGLSGICVGISGLDDGPSGLDVGLSSLDVDFSCLDGGLSASDVRLLCTFLSPESHVLCSLWAPDVMFASWVSSVTWDTSLCVWKLHIADSSAAAWYCPSGPRPNLLSAPQSVLQELLEFWQVCSVSCFSWAWLWCLSSALVRFGCRFFWPFFRCGALTLAR